MVQDICKASDRLAVVMGLTEQSCGELLQSKTTEINGLRRTQLDVPRKNPGTKLTFFFCPTGQFKNGVTTQS